MNWLVWAAGAWLLAAPGIVIGRLLRLRGPDVLVRCALMLAAGIAFWPLLTLWSSLAGLHWKPRSARAFVIGLTIVAIFVVATDWRGRQRLLRSIKTSWLWLLAFVVLLAATIWTRWMHASNLAFPPWVDAVHHTMILRLILDHGSLPQSLSPYIEGGDFYYHWGFHALAAWIAWVTGVRRAIDMPRLLLDYGQFLNSLTLVMVYAAARVLLRSRWAALVAGGLATLVSYFPAYYLSWGRYTHLSGILLLPPLLIAVWQIARRPDWRSIVLAVLLASGLALVHVRVAFFGAVFGIELASILLWRRSWRALAAWALAAAISFAIVSPWLLRVARDPYARAFIAPAEANAGDVHQILPVDILWAPHNRELLAIATCGISGIGGWLGMPLTGRFISAVWWLLCIWLARKRHTAAINLWKPLALLGVFCGAMALLLGYHGWGIDFTRFASVSSAVMSLFLPLSIAAAAVMLWVGQQLLGRSLTIAISLVLIAATVLSGVLFLRDVVNPVTVFADENDRRALDWIDQHTSPAARFGVNAYPWMATSWVGSDGGYWISVATNRRSTLPPLLYAWTLPIERVAQIDRLLYDSNRADVLTAESVLLELRAAGVTHLYCGSRADPNRLRALLKSGHARLIHREEAAVVLQISEHVTP